MDKHLEKIIARIVEEVDPDKIILFGSRAKGKNRKSSDYDVCVLKRDAKNKSKLAKRIYRKLFGVGASVDIIVETPEKYNELKDKWFLVYSDIAKNGRLIYEK